MLYDKSCIHGCVVWYFDILGVNLVLTLVTIKIMLDNVLIIAYKCALKWIVMFSLVSSGDIISAAA